MTQLSLCNERYILRKVLGEGGMATVYVAYDRVLDVHRAIKMLAPRLCEKMQIRRRFLDEARAMARMRHPNIVTVHDVGLEGVSQPYIIMELIRGGSAGDLFDRSGPQTAATAGSIVLGALTGLQVAHDEGIVHRDIKPHNILLTRQGLPKLTDFGIAHIDDTDHSMTRTGAVLGTLAYMAPEQRRNTKGVGGTVDIYAAGATLFALLSNEEPFDLYAKELQNKLLIGIPDPLRTVIVRACEYEASERYSSAANMAQALREALVEMGVNLNPDGTAALPAGTKTLSGSWGDEDDESLADDSSERTSDLVGSAHTTDRFISMSTSGITEPAPVTSSPQRAIFWAIGAVVMVGLAIAAWQFSSPEPTEKAPTAMVPVDVCGDGKKTGDERCDDGNAINDDSCTVECALNVVFLHGSGIKSNVWIMGRETPYNERSSATYEVPQTPVMIHPMWMLRNEVTRESFAEFVEATDRQDALLPSTWLDEGRRLPANHVNFASARAYCQHHGGDLPTEAQWEYAARSGAKDIMYPWGNDEATCERVVLGDHQCSLGRPRDICSRPAGNSAQGICDLAGNVWEWVRPAFLHHPDDRVPMYPGKPGTRKGDGATDSEIRKGYFEYGPYGQNIPDSETVDIIRGGGHWMTDVFFNRARARFFLEKGERQANVGFRCIWPQDTFPILEKYSR